MQVPDLSKQVVSRTIMVAIGINALRLTGTRLVISDAQLRLKTAIKRMFKGS